MFIMQDGAELTAGKLDEFIQRHKAKCAGYEQLRLMYEGNHEILRYPKKQAGKPDNRLVVNYAKYIVDTLNSFFIGVPVKVAHRDEAVSNVIRVIDRYNDMDDSNYELAKIMSIYGHGYELIYNDKRGRVGITYMSPLEGFMIYDDTVEQEPMYGVRYREDPFTGELDGTIYRENSIQEFDRKNGSIAIDEERDNYFHELQMIEYIENEERQSAFHHVITLINAYNNAMSQKANDVDYFADSYMKILGARLDEKTLKSIADNRIINLEGDDSENVIVDFLNRPSADETQEHLIDRLESLIFAISMTANIFDESFGNSSGVALEFKLQSMKNLTKQKERKFKSGMNQRYKVICSYVGNDLGKDDWVNIEYQFTQNSPKNLIEQVQTAQGLTGITSRKTQLKVLSIVDDVDKEIEEINAEDRLLSSIPDMVE